MQKPSNYHSVYLKSLRLATGCSYIAYENYKGKYQIKTVKDKDTKYFNLFGSPDDVTPERYKELQEQIIKSYAKV